MLGARLTDCRYRGHRLGLSVLMQHLGLPPELERLRHGRPAQVPEQLNQTITAFLLCSQPGHSRGGARRGPSSQQNLDPLSSLPGGRSERNTTYCLASLLGLPVSSLFCQFLILWILIFTMQLENIFSLCHMSLHSIDYFHCSVRSSEFDMIPFIQFYSCFCCL